MQRTRAKQVRKDGRNLAGRATSPRTSFLAFRTSGRYRPGCANPLSCPGHRRGQAQKWKHPELAAVAVLPSETLTPSPWDRSTFPRVVKPELHRYSPLSRAPRPQLDDEPRDDSHERDPLPELLPVFCHAARATLAPLGRRARLGDVRPRPAVSWLTAFTCLLVLFRLDSEVSGDQAGWLTSR
jgi:hypothetical protein